MKKSDSMILALIKFRMEQWRSATGLPGLSWKIAVKRIYCVTLLLMDMGRHYSLLLSNGGPVADPGGEQSSHAPLGAMAGLAIVIL